MKYLIRVLMISLLLISTATLAAQDTEAESSAAADEQTTISESDATEQAAERLRHKDREVSVMDVPLDGTSIESFTRGLENVDENATEKEYRTLMSALDFLLFYDLGAKRDKAKLYARLNGKSPNDILAQVGGIRGKKKNKK